MNEDIIGLKLNQSAVSASVIKILRKYSSMSISELTNKVKNNEYVVSTSYFENEGIKSILNCFDELVELEIEVSLYEDGRECSREFLINLVDTYNGIENDDDLELENLFD